MQPLKKQITAFGLLLLVTLPLVLSVCFFVKQNILQNQRNQRFETEELQTFTVSSENISWEKAGVEDSGGGVCFLSSLVFGSIGFAEANLMAQQFEWRGVVVEEESVC